MVLPNVARVKDDGGVVVGFVLLFYERHRTWVGSGLLLMLLLLSLLFSHHYEDSFLVSPYTVTTAVPSSSSTMSSSTSIISQTTLHELVQKLRGNDTRLFRWDATKQTRRQQHRGGACEALPRALEVIQRAAAAIAIATEGGGDTRTPAITNEHVRLAGEYITFCVTDNPAQRQVFSQQDGIQRAILQLLLLSTTTTTTTTTQNTNQQHRYKEEETEDTATAPATPIADVASVLSHVIYITSFSNAKNHQAYIDLGAVAVLGSIITTADTHSHSSLQIMWAAAALQNLAASYCATEQDGRCYWRWQHSAAASRPTLRIRTTSLPLISDGTRARQQILQDPALLQRIVEFACANNETTTTKTNANTNEQPSIPWSMVAILKNIALEGAAHPHQLLIDILEEQPVLICICKMTHSEDWLEQNKAAGFWNHVRRHDPCWLPPQDQETTTADVCVDRYFVDDEGYDCSGYEEAQRSECTTPGTDITGIRTTTANEACCGPCGGGFRGG